jgi:hypothetical protein
MTVIRDRIQIYTILQTAALAEQSFDMLLLVDHADAGATSGAYKWITKPADLTTGTAQFDWATIYFSQARTPARLLVGRFIAGAGADVVTTALAKVRETEEGFWGVAELAATQPQQEALAAAVEASKCKFYFALTTAAGTKASGTTTDLASVLKALGLQRSAVFYTEHTGDEGYITSAISGCILPGVIGSVAFSWNKISNVWESGLTGAVSSPLNSTARVALEAKNCNYCEALAGINVIRKGVNASGVPVHLIAGMDWMNSGIQGDIYSFMLNNDNPAFDNKTLGSVEGIVKTWMKKAVDRTIILDTVASPILYSFPLASSFTASQKATGTLTLANCYIAKLNYPVQDVVIYGSWQI